MLIPAMERVFKHKSWYHIRLDLLETTTRTTQEGEGRNRPPPSPRPSASMLLQLASHRIRLAFSFAILLRMLLMISANAVAAARRTSLKIIVGRRNAFHRVKKMHPYCSLLENGGRRTMTMAFAAVPSTWGSSPCRHHLPRERRRKRNCFSSGDLRNDGGDGAEQALHKQRTPLRFQSNAVAASSTTTPTSLLSSPPLPSFVAYNHNSHQPKHGLFRKLPPRGGGFSRSTRLMSHHSSSGSLDAAYDNHNTQNSTMTSTSKDASKPQQQTIVSFLTDVEGDQEYLTRYVEQSRILQWVPISPQQVQETELAFDFPYSEWIDFQDIKSINKTSSTSTSPTSTIATTTTTTTMLVYGGDVWDKGGSDLYVIRQLLCLKARYPNRVHFILGNRDLNKMRILEELGPLGEPKAPSPHHGVYWRNNKKHKANEDDDNSETIITDDPVLRLQWMLRETMGSPDAFDYRRQEVVSLNKKKQVEDATSDDDTTAVDIDDENDDGRVADWNVVESYRASCHPSTGEMGMYLSQANLALRLGPALFVHGALPLTSPLLLLQRQQQQQQQHEEQQQQHHEEQQQSTTIRKNNGDLEFWNDLTKVMPWLEPGAKAQNAGVTNPMEWIQYLNEALASRAIQEWQDRHAMSLSSNEKVQRHTQQELSSGSIWSVEGGYHNPNHVHEFWTNLMQYGMGWTPDGVRNPTVVYNSWSGSGFPYRFLDAEDKQSNEEDNDDKQNNSKADIEKATENALYVRLIQSFFQKCPGLRVICTGHQPQGDMANVICVELGNDCNAKSSSDTSITVVDDKDARLAWLVSADTSYSGDVFHYRTTSDGNNQNDPTGEADAAALDLKTVKTTYRVGREGSKSGRGMRAVGEVLVSWWENTNNDAMSKQSEANDHSNRQSNNTYNNYGDSMVAAATNSILIQRHGTLSDGTMYDTQPLPMTVRENVHGVGKVFPITANANASTTQDEPPPTNDLWWTRAAFLDGSLLLCRGQDYHFWNYRTTPTLLLPAATAGTPTPATTRLSKV